MKGVLIEPYMQTLDARRERGGFHVGLIGDGVRRWARGHSVPLGVAYLAAVERVALFIGFFFEHGAFAASIYGLSKDNLSREPAELAPVLDAETTGFRTSIKALVQEWRCEVVVAGAYHHLPIDYVQALEELRALRHDSDRRLYILAAYDPLDEIRHALQGGVEHLADHLWVPERVDLLVRTSGERRISGFLPLQCSYAELYFTDVPINDLTLGDCEAALCAYRQRNRRFGH